MSVFSLVQKRAYLEAALDRPISFEQCRQCPEFCELQSLPLPERARHLERLGETRLDALISAHNRFLSQRISRQFAVEQRESRTA